MNEMFSNEIQRLREEFASEIRSLKAQVENLHNTVDRLSQSTQINKPTSMQEQLDQQMMARSANPDQETNQYSAR